MSNFPPPMMAVDAAEHMELTLLRDAVKEFFNEYLNTVEESDGGILFNPISINCCRSYKMAPLEALLKQMAKLSGAEAPMSKSELALMQVIRYGQEIQPDDLT